MRMSVHSSEWNVHSMGLFLESTFGRMSALVMACVLLYVISMSYGEMCFPGSKKQYLRAGVTW